MANYSCKKFSPTSQSLATIQYIRYRRTHGQTYRRRQTCQYLDRYLSTVG